MQELYDAKINFEPIKGFEWIAKQLNANIDDTIIEPNEAKLLENDDHPLPETFIRELVQNTLDAKSPDKSLVPKVLKLKIINFDSHLTQKIYSKFVNGTVLKWLAKSKNIENNYQLSFKALIASDFNTTGLTGRLDDSKSNWNKYITRVGDPDLSKEGSLGSAGIGKVATWSCSKLRMVFIRTFIDDPNQETRFIGRCLRRGNTEIPNKKNIYRASHEYFVKGSRTNVSVSEDLKKFLSNKLFRFDRDSKGTDLFFPEFNIFSIEELIPYTLKNWFAPILDGQLEIDMNGELINKANFKDMLSKYGSGCEGLDLEMMNFITNTRNEVCDINIELKKLDKTQYSSAQYPGDFFNLRNYSVKEITAMINAGKHLIIEVPIEVNLTRGGLLKDTFYIGMKYRSDKKGVPHFGLTLRDYQILWREVIFKRDAKYHNDLMITVISKNNITNKVLTYFEDASHLLFKKASFNGQHEFIQSEAEDLLFIFRNTSNKIINLFLEDDESENKDLMAGFFSYKRPGKIKKPTKKPPEEEEDYIDDDDLLNSPDNDIDLPQSKSHLIYLDQQGKKLFVNSIKDEEFCGQKILLSFGIKDRKGQPDAFKNINHFDLNFNSQTEISYYSGCNIDFAKLTQTTIEIDVENDSFNLEIDGAKDYLSYKLRYARIK